MKESQQHEKQQPGLHITMYKQIVELILDRQKLVILGNGARGRNMDRYLVDSTKKDTLLQTANPFPAEDTLLERVNQIDIS